MTTAIVDRVRRLFRRRKPTVVSSLADFVVTIDTKASGGDKIVVHLDRPGEPTLHMQAHITQFMWLIDDPEEFARAYAHRAHWVDPYATQAPQQVQVSA